MQYRHQAFLIFHERWEELILSINADQLLATRAVAIQLKRQRRYNDAIALMNQVLDNARTVFGEKSFNYAMMISQVADINRLKGDLLAAEQAYRQTVEIFKATVDPNHPLLGEALNGLGLVLRSANRLTEAEQYLTQGTDIFKNAYGENSPYYVFALNNMAELYAIQGRHEQAIATYEQLLAIQRQFPRHVTDYFGDRLCRLGALYYELAQYPKAIQILQEASQVALQLYGEDNMNYATTLSDLALQYKMLGDWDQAEKTYKQAIKVAKTAMGDDNSHYAVYTSNLGNLYVERGRYREALPLLLKASAIFEKANKLSSEYATSLNNLAVLYNDMGQPEKAQELFQQSLEVDHQIFGDGDPKLIQDWMNLSTTLMQDQQYIEAAKFLKKAYDVAVKTLPPKHPTFARILQRFGDIYLDSGQFKEAETYAVMAEDIWWTTVGENNPDHADALIRMAWVARALGRYQDAENVTRRALNVYQQTAPEAHARLAEAHRILTGICAATDRAQEALAHMQELALAGDRQIGQVLSIGTENQRLSAASSVLSDLYLFISLALSDQNAVPKAFDLVLRRKAIDAEALAAQRDSILAGRNSSLEPQFRELGALRMQIARKTLAGPGPEGPDTHQKLLKEWKARQESLESELAQKVPEMDLEQKLHKADHQAVAEALPDGSALIEFVRFGKFDFKAIPAKGDSYWKPARYLAFILLARQPDKVEMIDLGEADSIDRQIALFRQSITGNKELIEQKAVSPAPKENTNVSVRSDRPSLCTALAETTRSLRPVVTTTEQLDRISIGTELRRILFDRLLPTLEGRTRLFLATDSNLTRLPFEVLPMDEKSCIIDSYQVSYLSTGRDILRFGASINRHPAEPIVAADPNFDLGGTKMKHFNEGFPFQRLEGTRQEGEKIASLLKVTPLFQDTVLEKTLKAHKSPRIMHISTHGFFMPNSERAPNKAKQTLAPIQIGNGDRLSLLSVLQNPLLQSGLALAGANTWLQEQEQVLPEDAEDGILSAEDVSGLDLLDTELVVLSACETGLGSIQAGEGVFGFQRAFTIAGAKTLVMSLWKVPDNATKILMEKFYQFVLDGMPRFEALCKAKMAVKQQLIDEGQENNPFLWGAFICQGDPGPLGKWQDSVSTAGETR